MVRISAGMGKQPYGYQYYGSVNASATYTVLVDGMGTFADSSTGQLGTNTRIEITGDASNWVYEIVKAASTDDYPMTLAFKASQLRYYNGTGGALNLHVVGVYFA